MTSFPDTPLSHLKLMAQWHAPFWLTARIDGSAPTQRLYDLIRAYPQQPDRVPAFLAYIITDEAEGFRGDIYLLHILPSQTGATARRILDLEKLPDATDARDTALNSFTVTDAEKLAHELRLAGLSASFSDGLERAIANARHAGLIQPKDLRKSLLFWVTVQPGDAPDRYQYSVIARLPEGFADLVRALPEDELTDEHIEALLKVLGALQVH